jgi:succinate dehydrogenase / fumarate reductase cytochrome b subunit
MFLPVLQATGWQDLFSVSFPAKLSLQTWSWDTQFIRIFMTDNKQAVKFLNLLEIRFPATAYLSIGHRISGVMLFLAIPLLIYSLELSLRSEHDFHRLMSCLDMPLARGILVLYAWIFAHHFLAGIRFLILDMDIGVNKQAGRYSAWLVFITGFVCMLVAAWCLL